MAGVPVCGVQSQGRWLLESLAKLTTSSFPPRNRAACKVLCPTCSNTCALPVCPWVLWLISGAGSITNHLVMPKSKGLYRAAVLESGSFTTWSAHPLVYQAFAPPPTRAQYAAVRTLIVRFYEVVSVPRRVLPYKYFTVKYRKCCSN